jgi:hypothetical protein
MTPEQKRRILVEARETLARLNAGIITKPYQPPLPSKGNGDGSWPADEPLQIAKIPLVSCAPMDAWRADGLRRQQAKLREDVHRRVRAREERSNVVYEQGQAIEDQVMSRVEQRLQTLEDALTYSLQKIDAALDELADAIRELQEQQTSGRGDKSKVVDLPGPFLARRRASTYSDRRARGRN